jgi:hypothetical protein
LRFPGYDLRISEIPRADSFPSPQPNSRRPIWSLTAFGLGSQLRLSCVGRAVGFGDNDHILQLFNEVLQ